MLPLVIHRASSIVRHWSFIVCSLCLVAIRPWFRLEPVCSDDFAFHLLRLVQLDALLRRGVLYSRWAPDMALGYGYPFFNFYAPLSYYIAGGLALAGLSLRPALIATFALSGLGAGLAAYRLARDYFSARSSLVAAVAYAYAPYLAYDAFFRANLAETLAWAFLPLALWAMGRLARRGGQRYLVIASLAYAAVLLTHNVFALIFSPLLAIYGVVIALTLPPAPSRHRRLAAIGGALLLGLGLTAFFWLPALTEQAYIHSDRLLVPPVFVYWNNFIDLRELLAAPRAIHPDLLNPSPPRTLGLLPVLTGGAALIGLWRFRDRPRRVQIAFLAAATTAYAWLTTTSSRFVWDNVPLLEYVQFPWRLLGPAALCLAVLNAAAAELFPTDWRGGLATAVVIAVLIGGSLFWLDPRYCQGMEAPTTSSIAHFERTTHTIGTTAKGEYLPRTVQVVPEEEATTVLDPSSLPPGTTLTQPDALHIGAELIITSPQPFTAIYNGFDYPGWRVSVDDAAVPITPDVPYGRITFPVPEGHHRVSIRFSETPLRQAADGISIACLILILILLIPSPSPPRGEGRGEGRSSPPLPPGLEDETQDEPSPSPPRGEGWGEGRSSLPPSPSPAPEREHRDRGLSPAWASLGLALLGIVTMLQVIETPLRQPGLQDGQLPDLDVPAKTHFEGGLTLLGFNQERTTLPSGAGLRLDLFWTAREPPLGRYQRAIALLGPDGLRWNPKDTLPPRDFREPPPTQAWPIGTYVQDSHYIETLPGTPPGLYDLSLTLFEQDTLVAMRALEAEGQPGPPALTLGTVTVTRPQRRPDPAGIAMQYRLETDLGPLQLLGLDLDRTEVAPGDPILITLFWLATESPAADLTARLTLLTASGSPVATFDLPPTNATHPTSAWHAGDVWRGQHLLHLPAALEDGDHTWRLGLLPTGPSIDLPPTIHVTAPVRTFAPPPVDVRTDTRLGDLVTLIGATLEPEPGNLKPGDTLTVTLVWRAEKETLTSYHVFLHLLGPDGELVAQSDGIPAGWARPTTGWLPGEHINDVRTLIIPTDALPGHYTLSAGLYEPAGARLASPDGRDAILLTAINVAASEEP